MNALKIIVKIRVLRARVVFAVNAMRTANLLLLVLTVLEAKSEKRQFCSHFPTYIESVALTRC